MRTSLLSTSTRWGERAEMVATITAAFQADTLARDVRKAVQHRRRNRFAEPSFATGPMPARHPPVLGRGLLLTRRCDP